MIRAGLARRPTSVGPDGKRDEEREKAQGPGHRLPDGTSVRLIQNKAADRVDEQRDRLVLH